ncbi:flagellar biosynthesis protein FliQ [Nisaea acidiphila]|uniref:Flagellar biosynthetic protein FliQ n=1 Tax=Nisaea acidiphila TaxID=1862145 RepID=A0A9J7AW16_9PROT|nr:flagellar biosynthesis protein FliQ [Nisaea acidiphila]UUX50468.1 flagellar biosynthesis protein FliQ [Nisaea acidiphila]
MNEVEAIEIGREAVMTMLTMSTPIMLVGLAIGLLIALFQALTQLQEMTLVFVPKIIVVFAALIFFLPFMLNTLNAFMQSIADKIISLS